MAKPGKEQRTDSDSSLGRRNFIRQSMVSLGVTVHEYLKHRDTPSVPKEERPEPTRLDWLRPPGAAQEADFLERCTKCNDCIDVCPHQVIRKNSVDGTPIIFPEEAPCQLCEDFPCVRACETEALLLGEGVDTLKMGLAIVSHRDCTAGHGCNACVSKCPTNAIEMDFSALRVVVKEELCVGCGICQQICKSVNDRVAIKVLPARTLASSS